MGEASEQNRQNVGNDRRALSSAAAGRVYGAHGGFRLKALAFKDPMAFTYWEMAKNLNPALKINILYAGEGTFRTDLRKRLWGTSAAPNC
jgi:hypothetical protein